MGSSMAFFTKISANHQRKELITFYFFYAFVILVILFLFVFLLQSFGYINHFLPNISLLYIYMGLLFSFLTWLMQIFIKISDAYALTASVELIKIGHKILSLLFLFYLIYFTAFHLDTYFYFQYIAFISLFFILIWLFIKKGILKNIPFKIQNPKSIIQEFIEYCHPLVAYSMLGLLIGFLNIWMLQKYGGSIQTGFYGLAYSLAAICFLFTSAMTPIITREFSKAYGENNLKKMGELFLRYIPMLYSISAYFGVFIAMQSENVLAIFTDAKFFEAKSVLVIMALYPIHQTYGQLSGSIFYATENTKLYRNIAFFTQPFMLFLSYLFIVQFQLGAIGLALSMVISQFMSVNIGLYFNTKFLHLNNRYFVLHQLYSILFFVVLSYIASHLFSFESNVVEFLVSGFLYTIFVIIFTYIFPQVFAITKDEIKASLLGVKSVIKK
ncbi:Membrane protein involved in the export of O-antigen, teichoic acid lipoteichoic acids [hydrothermal vent metagenome]|uniref:Membrane protein involved in the export of O-antigen, teichoic acid lipoteichoic acids n=1 Tax=hydrothermal vent metagenome TaxID=652676 RepID=A0A1W1D4J9_9ZZZZ